MATASTPSRDSHDVRHWEKARQARSGLGDSSDQNGLAVLVSCIGRRLLMGQRTMDEVEAAGEGVVERGENLFLHPLDENREWYRYHRLFADLLRQRLQQSESNIAECNLRASQWYADHGYSGDKFAWGRVVTMDQKTRTLVALTTLSLATAAVPSRL